MATTVGRVKITASFDCDYNDVALVNLMETNVSEALYAMATATMSRARMVAPRLNGYLRDSGRVENESKLSKSAVFGNGNVLYARYQEFGGDGRRKVRHYTTPGTGPYYLKNSGESVAKEGIKKYL